MRGEMKSSWGPSGVANVSMLNNGVRVAFDDSEGNDKPLQTFDIVGEDAWKDDRPSGRYRVSLNVRKDSILSVGAVPGVYVVSFVEFGKRDTAGLPQPWIMRGGPRTGKNGKSWFQPDSLKFTVKCRIHSSRPEYNGLTATTVLPYIFERDVDGNTYYTGNGYDMEQLERFLSLAGYDFENDNVRFSENILPALETLLQSKHKEEAAQISGGRPVMQAEINPKGFLVSKSFGPHLVV